MKELLEQSQILIEEMNDTLKAYSTTLNTLDKLSREELEARQEFIKVSDQKTLEYTPMLEGLVDPSTGRANKDWSNLKLREMLNNDSEYSQAEANAMGAEMSKSEARSNQSFLLETLGAQKAQARLYAAMIEASNR